jgi:hypothetical protein
MGIVGIFVGVPLAIAGIVTGNMVFMAVGISVALTGYALTRMDTSD